MVLGFMFYRETGLSLFARVSGVHSVLVQFGMYLEESRSAFWPYLANLIAHRESCHIPSIVPAFLKIC